MTELKINALTEKELEQVCGGSLAKKAARRRSQVHTGIDNGVVDSGSMFQNSDPDPRYPSRAF